MPSVTDGGWPFHEETDSVEEWAATSGQLAAALQALPRIEARSVVVAVNTQGNARVVFPRAFPAAPLVVACPGDSVGVRIDSPQWVGGTTATYFDMGGLVPNTASVRINYIAIGAQ